MSGIRLGLCPAIFLGLFSCAQWAGGGFPYLGLASLQSLGPYAVGGTVSGLVGGGLVLRNNGSDDLSIASDGIFLFVTKLDNGSTYQVTVFSQPTSPYQSCLVSNGSGVIQGGNVTGVLVDCGAPRSLDDGPVVEDPFGDAIPGGQLFVYNGKVHIGPNATETAVYEFSSDLMTSTTVTVDGDGTAGLPYTSFIGLPNASGTNLAGIDVFYSACIGASPAILTGNACATAGGTEENFIGGFIVTNGGYKSVWHSGDQGTIRTYAEISGLETGGNNYRSMSMAVFKDQLYIALQDSAGGAVKFSRICMKIGGCDNGDLAQAVTMLNGKVLNHLGKTGLFTNDAPDLVSIDSMWEYDNDGTGGNPSQLYLAGGGATGALPSTSGQTHDGGILRSGLAYSISSNPPPICPNATDCALIWEDVTPTQAKWLAYMSIALPSMPDAGQDWDALLPANRITPAIKAVPALRTAPNGDLYLIRNACSDTTIHSMSSANFISNGRQTCPQGSEIPQLWMLPAGTTASPKGAGDWVLVAEAGTTGRTDMSGNAGCISGANRCDTENTHITLLEFNGDYLYIGYDNATHGANVWRADLSAVVSGTVLTESSFTLVGDFGLGFGAGVTRIFSEVTVGDGSTDFLLLMAGDGINPLKVFRTDNN